jgi:two-component system response regulator PilR (NtrC family)
MNSTPRILLVDDHQDTLDLFAIVLSQQNYEVVTASTIERAFQETKDQQFHLVILDSRVGDGSGVDLCRSIRKGDKMTPIVFCSGLTAEKNKQEALDAGAQAYLIKPVSIADLYATVKDWTSISSRRGDGATAMRKTSGDLIGAPS